MHDDDYDPRFEDEFGSLTQAELDSLADAAADAYEAEMDRRWER